MIYADNTPHLYRYRASVPTIESIYDGDTIKELLVDVGFGVAVTIEGRLYGINTPEIRPLVTRAAATLARDRLRELLLDQTFEVQTLPDKTGDERQGKFGRWLVILWIDDVCVNDLLLMEGHGVAALYGDDPSDRPRRT